jgi:ABC-2 type transport system ATP-binding protein
MIIEIENLSKKYGEVQAVNGISLAVKKGEMFGIVGPDGAGKTTTIRILCGLLIKSSGTVHLLDKDISQQRTEIQKSIGYLSQKFSLYEDLTVDENIEFFAEIHNVSDYQQRSDELLKFTRLINFRERLAGKLSGGMKQKLALACSLIHKPQIIFLDEPTTGVDPVSRRDFWKILAGLQKDGITIVLTTPYLDEAERCNRVAMMDAGKIIALDTPQNIKSATGKSVIEIVCDDVKNAYKIINEDTEFESQMFGDRINILVNSISTDKPVIDKIFSDKSIKITSWRETTPTLENVFMYKIKEAH